MTSTMLSDFNHVASTPISVDGGIVHPSRFEWAGRVAALALETFRSEMAAQMIAVGGA